MIALPVVFYKPETKFAAGLAGVYVVESKEKDKERHSSYEAKVLYTQRRQIICEFYPDIWLGDNHFDISLLFSKYPYLFYGIGNQTLPENEEDYVSRIFQCRIDFQRTVYRSFAVGLVADMDIQKFLEKEEGGFLDLGTVTGHNGGNVSGLGFSLNWDSRDNNLSCMHGRYALMSLVFYNRQLGSDFTYQQWTLDARQFRTVFKNHVIAFQCMLSFIHGDPPFYRLSLLGGDDIMRGYLQGQYRDRHLMAVQAEYRLPLFWRFGMVGFCSAGEVAPDFRGFQASQIKYAAGLGVRFALQPKKRLKVGVDVAFAEGGMEYYLAASEAF